MERTAQHDEPHVWQSDERRRVIGVAAPTPAPATGRDIAQAEATQAASADARAEVDQRYRPLQVLAALHALEGQLVGDQHSHTFDDIARLLDDIPRPTICRILRAAEDRGLLARPERGRYTMARPGPSTPIMDQDDRDNSLLMRLHESTQAPALLYAPALLAGATMRVLVGHVYGRHSAYVLRAPREQQIALRQSPLRADPAGLAILTQLVPERDLEPQLLPIRAGALSVGRSPISHLAMLAAPVWRGRTIAGCLAVLPPMEILGRERELARVSHLLMSVARTYSRRTTAETVFGDELDDVG